MLRAHNLAQTDQVIQGVFARRLRRAAVRGLTVTSGWEDSAASVLFEPETMYVVRVRRAAEQTEATYLLKIVMAYNTR